MIFLPPKNGLVEELAEFRDQLPPIQTAPPAAATQLHTTVLPVLRSAAGEDGRAWRATGQRLPVHQRVRHEDH